MYVSEVVMVVAACPICRTGVFWGLLATTGYVEVCLVPLETQPVTSCSAWHLQDVLDVHATGPCRGGTAHPEISQ